MVTIGNIGAPWREFKDNKWWAGLVRSVERQGGRIELRKGSRSERSIFKDYIDQGVGVQFFYLVAHGRKWYGVVRWWPDSPADISVFISGRRLNTAACAEELVLGPTTDLGMRTDISLMDLALGDYNGAAFYGTGG